MESALMISTIAMNLFGVVLVALFASFAGGIAQATRSWVVVAVVLVVVTLSNLRVRRCAHQHCSPEDPRLRPFLTVTQVLLALAWIGLAVSLALIYLS